MLRFFNKRIHNRKGFTLIELIVVIAILGILAVIAIPRFAGVQANARIRTHNANVRTIESAIGVAQAETGDALDTFDSITDDLVTPGYLKAIPVNPIKSGTGSGTYSITDGTVSPAMVVVSP